MPRFHILFAVHIADGFLTVPWLVGGFVGMVILGLLAYFIDFLRLKFGGRELREEEIALIGVMTAAFYVASLMRLPIGPTTVHLLLNGLIGVVLRWRAALVIPIGLFFQAIFFGHGGFTTLGINSIIQTIPALVAWGIFAGFNRLPCLRSPWFRGLLVAVSVYLWLACAVFSVSLLWTNQLLSLTSIGIEPAMAVLFHPITVALLAAAALGFALWEPRLENAPEFPLGLLIGTLTVLLTLLPHSVVLVLGGEENWQAIALISFAAHLPVAAVEGIVLGFTVGFLAKVKPSLLGWSVEHQMPLLAEK